MYEQVALTINDSFILHRIITFKITIGLSLFEEKKLLIHSILTRIVCYFSLIQRLLKLRKSQSCHERVRVDKCVPQEISLLRVPSQNLFRLCAIGVAVSTNNI